MKKQALFAIAVSVLTAMTHVSTIQAAPGKAGSSSHLNKSVDMKFTAVDGREVDLASLKGKVVLIDFWATWCGPCKAELPNVIKAYKKLHSKGFEIIGISLDSDKAKLEGFTKEQGMEWPQFFDGKGWGNEIAVRYGINAIPEMWLVDKHGKVVSTGVRGKLEVEVEKYLRR